MARRDFDASPVTPSHPMELLVGDQRSDGNRIRFPPSRPGGEIIPRQCKPGGAAGGRREKKEQRKDQPRGHKNARPEQLRQPRLTSLRLPHNYVIDYHRLWDEEATVSLAWRRGKTAGPLRTLLDLLHTQSRRQT